MSREYQQTNQMIHTFMNRAHVEETLTHEGEKEPLQVEYVLATHQTYANLSARGQKFLTVELKLGTRRAYVVKKLGSLLHSIDENLSCLITTNFAYDPSEHYFLPEDQEILHILRDIWRNEAFLRMQRNQYGSVGVNERALLIPPMVADRLLSYLAGRNVSFEQYPHVHFQSQFPASKLPLVFQMDQGSTGDFALQLGALRDVVYFDAYGWLFHAGVFYKLSASKRDIFSKLASFLQTAQEPVLAVSQEQMEPLFSYVIPGLKEIGQVQVTEEITDKVINLPLQAKVYIDWQDGRIFAKIEYHYGDILIDPFHPEEANEAKQGMILVREAAKEQTIMQLFESSPFKFNGKECYLEGMDEMYDFLFSVVPRLKEYAEIYLSSPAKSLLAYSSRLPVTRVDLDATGNLLEVSFDIEGIDQSEIRNILQHVVERKKYYRMANGMFVSLEEEGFDTIRHLFTDLQLSKAQMKAGTLHLPLYRGLQIEDILGHGDRQAAKLGKKFRRLLADLKNPDTIDDEVPSSLQATLRDYQLFGFQWLKMMAHYRLGGILADDMGLGKTLQAIAYLLSEKANTERATKTSLVVVPASLVYNWKSECEKYAPELEVAVIYGTPEERHQSLRTEQPDLFITSYPLLRQDLEFYEQMEFDTVILDEAQAIKNHQTKTAHAVKTIKAAKRFALSGTPIENSLDELWSIFDAILPGFFISQRAFRSLPQETIARMVRPFILRRLKQDVLQELPEKIETLHLSELTRPQKELYLAYLEKIQQETRESLQREGFDKMRMKILAGLTRLRQLCCHPALFIDNYEESSGKLMQLLEMVENALENKRRILIFSQFTRMLQIIREELEQMNVEYFYLDGQTPSRDRVEMTERFNSGEKQLFLISLKAGGTGLNLPGADTVILYDLWWNPAVEEQATGRAHRMGQKNSVQVMRLITRGTIEEKIYEMQQRKRELIEQVIQSGETMLTGLSEDDVRELLGI